MNKEETTLESVIHSILSEELLNSNNEYMSPEISQAFIKVLHLWKENLLQDSQKTLDNLKKQDLAISDLSDQASQEEAFAFYLKERDREKGLLKKINEALLMIEKEEYGYCMECGVEIGYDRLIARLTATMCIDCKSAQEQRDKHKNG